MLPKIAISIQPQHTKGKRCDKFKNRHSNVIIAIANISEGTESVKIQPHHVDQEEEQCDDDRNHDNDNVKSIPKQLRFYNNLRHTFFKTKSKNKDRVKHEHDQIHKMNNSKHCAKNSHSHAKSDEAVGHWMVIGPNDMKH